MELEEELRVVANNLKSLEVFANDLRQPFFREVDRILMIKGRRGEGKPERKILQGEHQEPDCQAEAGIVCFKICTTHARRFSHPEIDRLRQGQSLQISRSQNCRRRSVLRSCFEMALIFHRV